MLKLSSVLGRAMIGLSGISIIAMLGLVVVDVALRALFKLAIPGMDTVVAAYLMVAVIFFPLAILQLRDENIVVDVFHDMAPPVVRKLFDLVAHVLTLVFYALLAWLYFKVAREAIEIREYVTGTWDVPIWPARIIMPLGLTLAAYAAFAKIYAVIHDLITGEDHSIHTKSGAI